MNGKWAAAKIAAVLALAFSVPAGASDLRSRPIIPPQPLSTWSGFYGGANFGDAFPSESGASLSTDPSGVIGRIQFGYNYLFSPNWLVGLEVEFDWTSGRDGTGTFATPNTAGTFSSNHNWYDIVAGRLGYTAGNLFSPRSTVHNYFVWWQCDRVLDRIHHALYVECRDKAEREASPTAAIIDSQSDKVCNFSGSCSRTRRPIHHAVHDRTHIGAALSAARLRRWKERLDIRPLVVRQIARVPQVITIVSRSVLMRPHRRSPLESDRFP
jgi:hypothetical protein